MLSNWLGFLTILLPPFFCDLVGLGIAPLSKKLPVKNLKIILCYCFQTNNYFGVWKYLSSIQSQLLPSGCYLPFVVVCGHLAVLAGQHVAFYIQKNALSIYCIGHEHPKLIYSLWSERHESKNTVGWGCDGVIFFLLRAAS